MLTEGVPEFKETEEVSALLDLVHSVKGVQRTENLTWYGVLKKNERNGVELIFTRTQQLREREKNRRDPIYYLLNSLGAQVYSM